MKKIPEKTWIVGFSKKHGDFLLISPVFLIVIAIGIIPFAVAFVDGFYFDGWTEKYFVGFENYLNVLRDEGMALSLKISVAFSFICTALSVLFAFPVSLTLSKNNRRSSLLYAALLVPWGIPSYILVPVWRAVLHGGNGLSLIHRILNINLNLLTSPSDAFMAAVFVSTWLVIPATAIVMLSAIKKISRDTLEAAQIEGADSLDISFRIILPQIAPSVATVSVLNFIKFFKEFTVIYLLTAGGPPLIDGITPIQIIGATTTSEVFIYNRFSLEDNFGMTSAYAGVMGLIICGFLLLFFTSKGFRCEKKTNLDSLGKRLLAISVVNMILGNGNFRYAYTALFFAVFLIGKRLKGNGYVVITILTFQFVFMTFDICGNGLLAGFDMALGISLLLFSGEISAVLKKITSNLKSKTATFSFLLLNNLISAILIILSSTVLFVLIYMSFSKYSTTYITNFLPESFTLMNFKKILFEEDIANYFLNSLKLSIPVAVITPLLCLPAAYYMTKKTSGASGTLLAILSFTGVFGGMHTLIPLYAVFRQFQLNMPFIPLILIYIFQSIPFSLFTIKSYLDSLPGALAEFARLEGMNQIEYVLKIVFPLSFPAIFTSFILSFLSAWNGFLAPLIFTDSESLYPISLKISSYVGSIASGSPKWNLFAALSMVNMLIIAVLFIWVKKPLNHTELSAYND